MSARRPTAAQGSLRVIAGTLRGRRFDAPPGPATRPTADRVRQATFNALESLDGVDGAVVADAFAGSGALGIEALSRGAAHVTFSEVDGAARRTIDANLAALALGAQARVLPGDGARTLLAGGPWDLVLLDPPYGYSGWPALLDAAASTLSPDGLVVVESDREIELPEALDAVRVKQYGGTVVTIASPRRSSS